MAFRLIHQPYLRLGWPLPETCHQLGWAGQGLGPRAKGAGLGCPSVGSEAPHTLGPVGRPHCPPKFQAVGGAGERGSFSALCPHPIPVPLTPHSVPSRGPGTWPGVAGAATTVQRVSHWAVEPSAGVGEGLGRWHPGAGWVRGSWPEEQSSKGHVSKSKDWLGSRPQDQSFWG